MVVFRNSPFVPLLVVVSLISMNWGLSGTLGLSWAHFAPWQLLTFPFALYAPEGFTFSWLMSLVFSGFLLWFITTTLIAKHRLLKTSLAVLLTTLITAGICLAILILSGYNGLVLGPSPLIYSLLVIWLLSEPHLKVALFGLIPIEPKTILLLFFGLDIISHLANERYMQILADASGVIAGVIVAKILFKAEWPFVKKRGAKNVRKGKVVEIRNWRDTP